MRQPVWVRAHPILCVTLAVTLLGCSSGDNDDEAVDDTTTTTAASAGVDGGSPSSAAGGSGLDTTGGGGAAPVAADPAARAALDRYLDALGANDFTAAFEVSADAMQALAVVRSIVHARNSEAGGTTTSKYADRTLTATAATNDEVRFGGTVALTSTVSGDGNEPVSTTDRFGDFLVRRAGDTWKVTGASYNGAAVVHHPATATATAGPVEVHLTGALAFGNSVAVVARLVATGEHEIEVRGELLRVGDEAATSMTRVVVGGQPGSVYVAYPRRDERPTEWRLTLRVDGTDHEVVLTF